MSEKEILEELQDIKKLLVLHLVANGVQKGEIEEILEMGDRNFGKSFHAGKLVKRMNNQAKKKVKPIKH
jgi:hypothetical protein